MTRAVYVPSNPDQSVEKPRNSVGLDEAALHTLLNERDQTAKQFGGIPKRQFVRWPFRVPTVKLVLYHPGGTPSTIYVACSNLSAGGIGALHRTYLHKGTSCVATLPKVDGSFIEVSGKIVRCSHVRGTIHDIGIQFATTVAVREFLRLDPFADGFSLECVNPAELKGTVLFLQDSEFDRAVIRHFLRETQLRVQFASSRGEAMARAFEAIDLILCDFNLGNDTGPEIVQALRAGGISVPIIMLTSD